MATDTDSPLPRVVAATEHARMLIFRRETLPEIDDHLAGLAHMLDRASLEAAYETAVELLALLPTNDFEALVARAQEHRRLTT